MMHINMLIFNLEDETGLRRETCKTTTLFTFGD